MTRKITNTCSHTLFMFFLSFISLKLVSLMFDVRVEKVITFHVRAHVHLHVGFPKLSIKNACVRANTNPRCVSLFCLSQ